MSSIERRLMMQQGGGSQGSGTEVVNAANFHQSKQWHEVEDIYLHVMKGHDYCAACNLTGKDLVQVHHIVPVEFCYAIGREDITLNPLNMISLCEGPTTNDHHVALGHLGDFHWYNPNIKQDVSGPWKDLAKAKIEEMEEWASRRAGAVPLQMSDQQKSELETFILATFGPKPPGTLDDWVKQLRQKVHASVSSTGETTPAPQ
jgi:hypothetical protein